MVQLKVAEYRFRVQGLGFMLSGYGNCRVLPPKTDPTTALGNLRIMGKFFFADPPGVLEYGAYPKL